MSNIADLLRFTLVLVAQLSCAYNSVRGQLNTDIVGRICNGDKFGLSSSFNKCLAALLRDLAENTAKKGYDYYNTNPRFPGLCYGHAPCKAELSQAGCIYYLEVCEELLGKLCHWSLGYQVQLEDCRLWIEKYYFKDN